MSLPVGRLSPAPYKTISRCRACGMSDLPTVMDLGDFYISCFPEHPTESLGRAPLELVRCPVCTLVQLRHEVERGWLYREYWYRSGTNETMVRNLQEIVKTATWWRGPRLQDVVVDIGANDGTLLRAYPRAGYFPRRVAFEPADTFQDRFKGFWLAAQDYFPPVTDVGKFVYADIKGRVAIVTSIAMFYDLPDPQAFAQAVHDVLAPDGVWVLELSYLPSMLGQLSFDTICHEHLEYYSLTSLDYIFCAAQMKIVSTQLNDVNGGSIRLVVAREDGPFHNVGVSVRELGSLPAEPTTFKAFAAKCEALKTQVVDLVQDELDSGGVVDVYGASTKGNTLLQYFGLDHTYCRWAIDRAPEKWGRYTVATSIPIVSEDQARKDPATMWVVPIWHFREAVVAREREFLGGGGKMLFPLPKVEVVTDVAT